MNSEIRKRKVGRASRWLLSWAAIAFLMVEFGSADGESAPSSARPVHTETGPIAGVRLKSLGEHVDAYLGIPFAEPPVGDLRFQKPVPIHPWNDTLQATRKPKGCVQTNFSVFEDAKLDMSDTIEDCLYLNVWVPRRSAGGDDPVNEKPLPVFVFIYGGLFTWGSSGLQLYDGLDFAARSRVIYVNFNYRVNLLGFLNASSPEAPGNMGLYDQVEALRWISRNIQYFGGDPAAVTLAGHSAGAASVSYHMMSDLSKGLFRRAVLFSGSPAAMGYSEYANQRDNFRTLGHALNCTDRSRTFESQVPDVVRCLRQVDAHELTKKAEKALSYRFISVLPGYGDAFLKNSPLDLDHSRVHIKEIFLGTTPDEGAYLVSQMLSRLRWIRDSLDGPTAFRVTVRNFMNMNASMSQRIAREYFGDGRELEQWEVEKALALPITDAGFNCGTSFFAKSAVEQNATVFRYLFNYRPSYSYWHKWITATHADELPFFLGSVRRPVHEQSKIHGDALTKLYRDYRPTSDELHFANDLVDVLSEFVRTG